MKRHLFGKIILSLLACVAFVHAQSGPMWPLTAGGGASLPTQTGQTGQFLTTDGTNPDWVALAGGGDMLAANNLSDVISAATARTNLGATTTGAGLFTLPNPSAIRFIRINANNTISSLDAAAFLTALDADLTTYSGITPSANVQLLLGAADYAAIRTQLGLVVGVNVQAFDADLTTYAGIAPSANVQTFLGGADYAALRTQLALVVGTNVQAWDADLDDLADGSLTGTKIGFTDTDSNFTATNIQAAVEELDDVINGGVPNAATGKVDWSELVNVPAGFADGADDGAGGGSGDITDVGDVATGAAFNGTQGTILTFDDAEGDLTFGTNATANTFQLSAPVDLGPTGVRISGDGDGAITWKSLSTGAAEDLTLNLDDTTNVAVFSSSTAVAAITWTGMVHNATAYRSTGADPADAGLVRLNNAEIIAWEASPTSTDVTLSVNSSEEFVFSSGLNVTGGGTFSTSVIVTAEAYDATGWDGDLSVPTKDDVRDKIEILSAGGTDAAAIHNNAAGEIVAIADKATPVAADHLVIEDSAAGDVKKDVTVGSLEPALEGVMDLEGMQGAVTDAQVPNTITVDLATTATNSTRTITIAGTPNEITSSAGAQDLTANRTWTLSLPTALTFTGKTVTGGTFNATTLTGAGGGIGLDASGFNGNLTTVDDTLQEISQKLDDLTVTVSDGDKGDIVITGGVWALDSPLNVSAINATSATFLDAVNQSHGLSLIISSDLTAGKTFTYAGAFNFAMTLTADTSVTFPTTGTLATLAGAETLTNKDITNANNTLPDNQPIACSDMTTAITAGTNKGYWRPPHACTLVAVQASAFTAPTGANILIDIHESGTTVLSTKLMIEAGEKTSRSAVTGYVISDSAIADDAEVTIDFDQVGSTVAGAGIIVTLIYTY